MVLEQVSRTRINKYTPRCFSGYNYIVMPLMSASCIKINLYPFWLAINPQFIISIACPLAVICGILLASHSCEVIWKSHTFYGCPILKHIVVDWQSSWAQFDIPRNGQHEWQTLFDSDHISVQCSLTPIFSPYTHGSSCSFDWKI